MILYQIFLTKVQAYRFPTSVRRSRTKNSKLLLVKLVLIWRVWRLQAPFFCNQDPDYQRYAQRNAEHFSSPQTTKRKAEEGELSAGHEGRLSSVKPRQRLDFKPANQARCTGDRGDHQQLSYALHSIRFCLMGWRCLSFSRAHITDCVTRLVGEPAPPPYGRRDDQHQPPRGLSIQK